MNERIKQLVKQSQPKIDWEARHYGELNNGEKLDYQNQWFEKFAELIVQECVNQILTGVRTNPPQAEPPELVQILVRRIEQHFGVAE